MTRKIDYLIIGQGLAGSAMAWELLGRGKSIKVIDDPARNQASAFAAGLFNPITGKYMTKAWLADEVFPFLKKFYADAEKKLNKKFLQLLPIYTPFISFDEKSAWTEKKESNHLKEFISTFHDPESFDGVRDSFGGIEISQSGFLNVLSWMTSIRHVLRDQEAYDEEFFREENLTFDEETVEYKGFRAGKVIFCNGVAALQSRWFGWLPIKPLKGETLDVRTELTTDRIYNRGVYLVPMPGENLYRVGATYQHPPFVEGPSVEAHDELRTKLIELISTPFDIIHQDWGIRPTTPDRRPLLGHHPANKNVVIFNGLGTKGVSLAPYFAHHLANWLEGSGDLSREVNIYRFKSLYSRLQ